MNNKFPYFAVSLPSYANSEVDKRLRLYCARRVSHRYLWLLSHLIVRSMSLVTLQRFRLADTCDCRHCNCNCCTAPLLKSNFQFIVAADEDVRPKVQKRGFFESILCCWRKSRTKTSQNGTPIDGTTTPPPLQGHQKYLLPQIRHTDIHKKCMVIDLDETLVHSSFKVSDVAHRVYYGSYCPAVWHSGTEIAQHRVEHAKLKEKQHEKDIS